MGGAVVSWLLCSTRDRAVRVRAQAEDIVLCFCAKYFTLTQSLDPMGTGKVNAGGTPRMD